MMQFQVCQSGIVDSKPILIWVHKISFSLGMNLMSSAFSFGMNLMSSEYLKAL
jgi:hypothetical protein